MWQMKPLKITMQIKEVFKNMNKSTTKCQNSEETVRTSTIYDTVLKP